MKARLWSLASTFALGLGALSTSSANAATIDPTDMKLVATVDTLGAYDNAGLDYYNGQPLSPTNYPSAYQDELSAQWNFYVNPSAKNELFIVASDVADSNFGYLYGEPFDLVALTGFDFSLPIRRNHADPSFSNQYGVPNEFLANGGPSGSNLPIDTTPGWSVASVSGTLHDLNYDIIASDENYAFTHFTYVYGATRILGGGVFELTYSPSVDLLRQANFRRLTASASNGEGAYIERGTLIYAYSPRRTNAVPEPSTWAMMLLGFTSLGFAGYRRARKSPESAAVAPTPPSCPLRRWVSDLREVVGGTAFAPRPQRNGRRARLGEPAARGEVSGRPSAC